jgi:hypothetical protein
MVVIIFNRKRDKTDRSSTCMITVPFTHTPYTLREQRENPTHAWGGPGLQYTAELIKIKRVMTFLMD